MEKLTFRCDEAGVRIIDVPKPGAPKGVTEERLIYFAKFTKTNEEPQRFYGQMSLESTEPMHYKTKQRYDINPTTHTDIMLVNKMPAKSRNN